MHPYCPKAVKLSRPAGPLVLSLTLPIVLALCLLARPYLGLPSPPQAGDCRGLQDEACGITGLGRSTPAAPLARLDPVRIHCAWKEFKRLAHSRHRSRASHSLSESLQIRDTMVECEEDYRCICQEVTPEGRHRAHLPVPDRGGGLADDGARQRLRYGSPGLCE